MHTRTHTRTHTHIHTYTQTHMRTHIYSVQACATMPSFGFFDRLDGPYRICTVQDGASTVCLKSTVPSVQGRCNHTVRF